MCDDCKEKTKDKKALKLHRLPEVLLIMLKRTMYPSTDKDDRHITFPLEVKPLDAVQRTARWMAVSCPDLASHRGVTHTVEKALKLYLKRVHICRTGRLL